MADLVLALAHTAALVALGAALVCPGLRPGVARGLLALGAVSAVAAALGGGTRTLELTHSFADFVQNRIELVAFPTGTARAPGFVWGLLALAFCAGWAVWLRADRPRGDSGTAGTPGTPGNPGGTAALGAGCRPFLTPLCLAWSGLALALGHQLAAAPRGLVDPLGFDRILFPASAVAGVLLAVSCRRVLTTLCWLAVFVTVARLPLVVVGTLATTRDLGTSLDVRTITTFANPLARELVRVEPGSAEQLGWLIWAPNLLVLPSLYMMSVGGIAFAASMWVLHPPPPRLVT